MGVTTRCISGRRPNRAKRYYQLSLCAPEAIIDGLFPQNRCVETGNRPRPGNASYGETGGRGGPRMAELFHVRAELTFTVNGRCLFFCRTGIHEPWTVARPVPKDAQS